MLEIAKRPNIKARVAWWFMIFMCTIAINSSVWRTRGMVVLGIDWFPFSEDIHLAPGFVSSRLVQVLVIATDAFGSEAKWGNDPAVHSAGIQVTFSSIPAAPGTGNSKITVHPTTGEVKLPDALPPLPAGEDWPQTMVVTAIVAGFNRQMRIVIHRALEKIWLAPSLGPADGLTVRVSAVVPGKGPRKSTRFSVTVKSPT
jgi:hypothetical protein